MRVTGLKNFQTSVERHLRQHILVYPAVTKTVCPTCGVDPVSGDGRDSNCATCGGTGYTETTGYPRSIMAIVRPLGDDSIRRRNLGNTTSGVVEFYCDAAFETIIKAASRVVINSNDYQVWQDDNGRTRINFISNIDGKLDRIKVVAVRTVL